MNINSLKSAGSKMAVAAGLAAAALASHAASFTVLARENSTAFSSRDASPLDTGLSFSSGQSIAITASGLWTGGGGYANDGPDGNPAVGTDPTTGLTYFSLVGRVGGGGYFMVGSSYSGTAQSSGDLFLAFLDVDSFNNTGSVTANVTTAPTIPAVPEPGTYLLMVVGLSAVALAKARKGSGAGLQTLTRQIPPFA